MVRFSEREEVGDDGGKWSLGERGGWEWGIVGRGVGLGVGFGFSVWLWYLLVVWF